MYIKDIYSISVAIEIPSKDHHKPCKFDLNICKIICRGLFAGCKRHRVCCRNLMEAIDPTLLQLHSPDSASSIFSRLSRLRLVSSRWQRVIFHCHCHCLSLPSLSLSSSASLARADVRGCLPRAVRATIQLHSNARSVRRVIRVRREYDGYEYELDYQCK